MIPSAVIPGCFPSKLAHHVFKAPNDVFMAENEREECCHFGTSGWVFTLWVHYFRAMCIGTLSGGFHFLFWLGVMAYITSALISCLGFLITS